MNTTTLNRERLIECRKKLGITKQQAAIRMQLSQPAYLRYESGERTPSIHVIYYMAHILGTSADYLTGKSDDPTPNCHIGFLNQFFQKCIFISFCQWIRLLLRFYSFYFRPARIVSYSIDNFIGAHSYIVFLFCFQILQVALRCFITLDCFYFCIRKFL